MLSRVTRVGHGFCQGLFQVSSKSTYARDFSKSEVHGFEPFVESVGRLEAVLP